MGRVRKCGSGELKGTWFCLFVSSLTQVSQTPQHLNLEFPFVKENFGGQKWKFMCKIYMRKGGKGVIHYYGLHIITHSKIPR